MKLTAFFLLAVILHVCSPALSQRVTIAGDNVSLEHVFTEIRKQTGMEFFYPSAVLKGARPVTLDARQMTVEEVLKLCLKGQGLGFNIRNNTIIVFEEEPDKTDRSVRGEPAPEEAMVIRGSVVDSRGAPVEMATVVLMRTGKGTQTGRSGLFTLTVKRIQPEDSLLISFVGLSDRRIRLNGQTDMGKIVLQVNDHVLEETIIVAYGNTTERYRTGDVASVKAVDIERTQALNVAEALSGRVPGLYVRQNNSNPAGTYNLQLRGINMVHPTGVVIAHEASEVLSKPLIVLDGLPMPPDVIASSGEYFGIDGMTQITGSGGGQDPLYWLNPLDIESVTVLKDAEATALYGSRAANGVFIITTKKGKPGKMALDFTFNTGINAQARKLQLLNTQEYLAMRHEAWDNTVRAGWNNGAVADSSYDLMQWDTTRYTDWQKVLLGSAPVYNAGLSLSGGEGHTAYRLSAGYNWFGSSYPHVQHKPRFREEKATLSFNINNHSLNNRLHLTASILATTSVSYQPAESPDRYILMAPNAPALFNAEGNINFVGWSPDGFFGLEGNPFAMLAKLYQANRFTMLARTSLSYEIVRSLVFTLGVGHARSNSKQTMTYPSIAIDPRLPGFGREANFGNSSSTGFNIEPNLRYKLRWTQHYFEVLAGGSFQSDKQEGVNTYATGFAADELLVSPAGAASITAIANMLHRKSIAALGRIAYRYAGKYLVDLSGRRDGSSSFGPGRRYGNFGSVGLGWIFTEEPWFKKVPLLTFGKLRGSYGITGSLNASPYAHLSSFGSTSEAFASLASPFLNYISDNAYQGIRAFEISRASNSTLGWAQAASFELGIDLYLLKDQRLKLTAQWYHRKSKNQLIYYTVSAVTGIDQSLVNLPMQIENKGLEIMIGYTPPQQRAGLNWYVNANLSANRNRLAAFPGVEPSYYTLDYEIGEPLDRRLLHIAFLDKKTGMYNIEDSLHPQFIAYYVGNNPRFTGGLQAGLSWKGFSLAMLWTFAKQKGYINLQGAAYPGYVAEYGVANQLRSLLDAPRWKSPADSTLGGAFYTSNVADKRLNLHWGDASYAALKNVSLTWQVPEMLLRKLYVHGLNVYARAENLLMLSLAGYKGMNPEQPGLMSQQLPLRMTLVGGFTINL